MSGASRGTSLRVPRVYRSWLLGPVLEHAGRRHAVRRDLGAQFLAEGTVVLAVEVIDANAQGKPGKQAPPVGGRKGQHQNKAARNSQEGNHGHKGTAERPSRLGIG